MKMIDFVICAITNLFRIYLVYRFAEIFLGKPEKSKPMIFGVCSAYYFANLILYWEFHTAWVNLTCNLIGICAVVFLFTKSIKANFFVTTSITLINIGCDALATLLYVQYKDGQEISQIYEVLTDLYILSCWFVIGKIVTNRKGAKDFFRISLISVPLCSIFLIMFMIYSDSCMGTDIAIVGIGLLIINIFMFYLYNQLLHGMSKEFEAALLEQKVLMYSNQLNTIMQSEERARALRHDMKHHINELMILANKNKAEEMERYLLKMDEFLQNPEEIVASGNIEIDSVLNYLLLSAKENLTTVNTRIMLPEDIKHSFDINVLLGNLLENAIEAAKQTEKKYLSVDISLKKGILFIQIENSYTSESTLLKNIERKLSYNVQKGRMHHGIGLKNVKRIVEAHNGSMEISKHEDIFCVKAMLYTSKLK